MVLLGLSQGLAHQRGHPRASTTLSPPSGRRVGATVTRAERGRHLAGRGRGKPGRTAPPIALGGSVAARDREALWRTTARLSRVPTDSKVSTPSPEALGKVENSWVLQRTGIESNPPPISSFWSDSLGATAAEMSSRPEHSTARGPGVHANKQKRK